jgi:hypothetical protein
MSDKDGSKKSSGQGRRERDDDGYIIIFVFLALFIYLQLLLLIITIRSNKSSAGSDNKPAKKQQKVDELMGKVASVAIIHYLSCANIFLLLLKNIYSFIRAGKILNRLC